ncbi:MAG: DUF4276 family protein [Desulfomonilaceae bacterium]
MSVRLVAIVEGQGDEKAVPILLKRILESMGVYTVCPDYKPVRQRRHKIVKKDELERAIQLAMRRKNAGAILVLLDADDDCPASLGPQLLERAKKASRLPVAVVLAKKEFEAWFLGCLESFRGFLGVPADAEAPDDPETVDGKGRLRSICLGTKYSSTLHQVAFASRMDFSLCRDRCPSFDKFFRDVEALVKAVAPVAG